MSATELENWLSKVKDFSTNDLRLAEETIQQEIKSRIIPTKITDEQLPSELRQELSDLASFSDKALWKVARSHLPVQSQKRLSQINYKQQKEGRASLTPEEIKDLNQLLYQHGRYIVLRAEAAVLLKKRGQDISSLGPK